MTTAIRSGIPTTYQRIEFRSRLEARWAAFFDLIDWPWVYEPLDTSGYIPDFLIKGKHPMFVEVGPCIMLEDYRRKTAKADRVVADLGHDLLVVGVDPLPQSLGSSGSPGFVAGLLGEISEDWGPDYTRPTGQKVYSWDSAIWGSDLDVFHSIMSYGHRPHGHLHDSRLYDASEITDRWAEATNVVKWLP